MKTYQQFLNESVNISGNFNGNLYINDSKKDQKKESYMADFVWEGNIYRLEIDSETILSKNELTERIQCEYPGAIVHNVYPPTKKSELKITNTKRYNPSRLEWV